MSKILTALFFSLLTMCSILSDVMAAPSAEVLNASNAQVLRVLVKHRSGQQGYGSAVVIARDQVVTNCHVVTDAKEVSLMVNGVPLPARSIKADWRNDLCVLVADQLDAPIALIGSSRALRYEMPVFTAAYPEKTISPVNTFGEVKGLFPMDGSVVIRASSSFKLGASGGGVFDESGSLVGVITLKSRGSSSHYYYMPVEWVKDLMQKPAQALGAKAELPFWAADTNLRPYFMRVVPAFIAHDWRDLSEIASEWAAKEPETAESWFYLALAEYEMQDYNQAAAHFRKVLALKADHIQAAEYLGKVMKKGLFE